MVQLSKNFYFLRRMTFFLDKTSVLEIYRNSILMDF